jgi:hypothetical protein
MKRNVLLMVLFVLTDCCMLLKADVINLYNPSDAAWQYVGSGVVRQVFTVPTGYTCTKFEFGASEGTQVSSDPINVQLYDSSSNTVPVATGSATATEIGGSTGFGWISVDGINLSAGVYSAQLFTNSTKSNIIQSLFVLKSPNYTYPGAYASTSWQDATTEVVIPGEFWSRMTLTAVPEPLTMSLMVVGGLLLRKKW